MSTSREQRIRSYRLLQPEQELLRKRKKAERRGRFTQEDIDHAEVWRVKMARLFQRAERTTGEPDAR